jgi:hypothetical protein
MNCKPGDMAYIVRSSCGNEGRVVEIVNAVVLEIPGDLGFEGCGHLWRCRSKSPLLQTFGLIRPGEDFAFPDAWLRPIRDPGDDATDESLLWLPSPTKETA